MSRPDWHTYFLQMADLVSTRSSCLKRHFGAVVVRDNIVVGSGYNGTPKGWKNCDEGGCPRCANHEGWKSGEGYEYCNCIHAEDNAITFAAPIGPRDILYINTNFGPDAPCQLCRKKIAQVGIGTIVMNDGVYWMRSTGNIVLAKRFSPVEGCMRDVDGRPVLDRLVQDAVHEDAVAPTRLLEVP